MLAFARLTQQIIRAPAHNIHTMFKKPLDDIDQPKLTRLAVDDRKHDDAEINLHLRLLIQVVQHHFSLLTALQFENDPHAVAIAFVARIGDAFQFLLAYQRGYMLKQTRFVDLKWNFGNDNRFAIFADLLGRGLRTEFKAASAFQVVVEDSLTPE